MAPYELHLLMHVHTESDRFDNDHLERYRETVNEFKRMGVIDIDTCATTWAGHGLKLTYLGERWLVSILNTPLPDK